METVRTSVLLLAAILHVGLSTVIPGFQECVLNNHRYAIDEMFHPVVEVNGTVFEAVCFECVCLPTAIAQCEQVICPPATCQNPLRFSGECCPICLPPPILTPDKSCLYNGIQINDGDVFRPTSIVEDYQSQQPDVRNECVECVCANREITCYNVSNMCPPLSCNETEAEYIDGECCKQCPVAPLAPVTGSGCYTFNGEFVLEGGWWHPTLPEYGVVTCVNCTCQDSLPHCERIPCPEVRPCNENDTVEDLILCCPTCNRTTAPPPGERPSTYGNDTVPTLTTPGITPCESPYIYKIYRHLYNDSLALHNLETSVVGVYEWITMVGAEGPVISREYSEFTEVEFIMETDGIFQFVGWTIDRRVRGLMNKRSKRERIEACTENCARMVSNMLRPVLTLGETLVCG